MVYDLPADFDLSPFIGAETNMITIGLFQTDISFIPPVDPLQPYGHLSMSGGWELTREGRTIDARYEQSREENSGREAYWIHQLLGLKVTGWGVDPPRAFHFDFENGYSLRIWDNTEGHYEYVSIQRPGDTASMYL